LIFHKCLFFNSDGGDDTGEPEDDDDDGVDRPQPPQPRDRDDNAAGDHQPRKFPHTL
jgi:hypothetical protein